MKLLPLVAALGSVFLAVTPAAAAPTIDAVLTCSGTGLVCSSSKATMGAGTEFTGNFGSLMPVLAFDFSQGLLKISNATSLSYGIYGSINLKFQDLSDAFTDASLVSSTGFSGLSQANFAVSNGVLSFSTTVFSAAQNASLTLHTGSVGAVPEPASWAMMILGMGMVGYALRRRSGTVVGARVARARAGRLG